MKVIDQKPLKSTTHVQGLLIKLENGQHYALTLYQPPRSSWRMRAVEATRTGRTSETVIFDKRVSPKPPVEQGIDMLIYYIAHPTDHPIDPLVNPS